MRQISERLAAFARPDGLLVLPQETLHLLLLGPQCAIPLRREVCVLALDSNATQSGEEVGDSRRPHLRVSVGEALDH